MITLVGLGCEKGDLTKQGEQAIKDAECLILRSELLPSAESVKELRSDYLCLDELYLRSRSYQTLYKKLAKRVLDEAKTKNVTYCIDGSVAEDRSAEIILKRKKDVKIISGVSKSQRVAELSRLSVGGYCALSAYELAEGKNFTLPLVVYDLDNEFLAGDVKLLLADKIGEEADVVFLKGSKVKKIKLYELDRQKDYTGSALAVKDIPLLEKKRFTVEDLKDIIVRLRKPDGCPWDKVQTPKSIRMNVVEEAYELVDAIDSGDSDKIREETGDVLLQAVFQAVMFEERGEFNLTDALSELCSKLIFRHSHIFGSDHATDEDSALSVWEKNKAVEKGQDTFSKAVNDVPSVFPACMRAQKVQKRAGKSGFDFLSAKEAAKKVVEELKEWEHAQDEGDKEAIQEELGDLLFAVVNVGRLSGVDTELALKESTEKFARRFTLLEEAIIADGKDIKTLNEQELDEYYQKIKSKESK